MISSLPSIHTSQNAQPRFGKLNFSCNFNETEAHAIIEANLPENDDLVTLSGRKIGTSETARLLSEKMRNDQLSVKELKKGLLKILGNHSDLNTSEADPTGYPLNPETALQHYRRVKDSIQGRLLAPRASWVKDLDQGLRLGNDMIGGYHMTLGDLRNCPRVSQAEQREARALLDKVSQALKRQNAAEFAEFLNQKDIFGDPTIELSPKDKPAWGTAPDRLLGIDDNFELFSKELGGAEQAKSFITKVLELDFQRDLRKGIQSGQWIEDPKTHDTSKMAHAMAEEAVKEYRP